MKINKFHQLWMSAIKIEEPSNNGSDIMCPVSYIQNALDIWKKNPVKGTIIFPAMMFALLGTVGYASTRKLYKKITDPSGTKEKLNKLDEFKDILSEMPKNKQEEFLKHIKKIKR